MTFDTTNFFSTTIYPAGPLDRDVDGIGSTSLWNFGDTPQWQPGSMASIYSSGGATIDGSKGTVSVLALDCAGAAIGDVTFDFSPAPATIASLLDSSTLLVGNSTTMGMLASVLGFNAEPGPLHISAQGGGHTFTDRDVTVVAGETAVLVVIRPNE